jgi:hypothetical protein
MKDAGVVGLYVPIIVTGVVPPVNREVVLPA